MSDASLLKEFLISLSFRTDENALRKWNTGIAGATEAVVAFAVAAEAASVAVVAAVAKMAEGLDHLFFASQRTNAAVQSIQALGYAASQMGSSVGAATGSLESLARTLRTSPGSEGLLHSLGVQTRDAQGGIRDTADVLLDLKDRLARMPFYQASQYAGMFGIDEKTLLADTNAMRAFAAEYKATLAAAGVDSQQAARDSNFFMTALRSLGVAFDVLSQKVTAALSRQLGVEVLKFRDMIVRNFGQISHVIEVLARGILALGAVITTFVRDAWMLVNWFDRLDVGSQRLIEGFAALLVAWRVVSAGLLASPLGIFLASLTAALLLLDDFRAYSEGGAHAIHWERVLKLGDQINDQLKPIGGIKGVLEGVLLFMSSVWVAGMLKGFFQVGAAAAATGTQVATIGGAGGMLARIARALGLAGGVGAFIYEMWPTPANAGEDAELKARGLGGAGTPVAPGNEPQKGLAGWWHRNAPYWAGGESQPSLPATATEDQTMAHAINRLVATGHWTRQQATGIVANLHAESNLNPRGTGDGGQAYGIAQWHPDRQADFKEWAGKELPQANLDEQLDFLDYELNKGKETHAGRAIAGATTAADAASLTSRLYERPAATEAEAARRAAAASALEARLAAAPVATAVPAPTTDNPDISAALDRARATINATQNGAMAPILGPSSNSNTSTTNAPVIHQKTDIHVSSTDPKTAANDVMRGQSRVNADLTRNMQSALA